MKFNCFSFSNRVPAASSSSSAADLTAPDMEKHTHDEDGAPKIASRTGAATVGGLLAKPCIFCDVHEDKGFKIVLEDDDLVVFRDIKPASAHHLQVVPKRHIDNVRSLRTHDVALVLKMRDAAHHALDLLSVSRDASMRRLGFHIPPYISVGHLHLHAHAMPFKNRLKSWKYPVRAGNGTTTSKSFSWFVEVDQAIAILERGGRVKIGSC